MKIIVTGGAGFIGSHIVDAYLKAGHQVTIVDNMTSGRPELVNPNAQLIEMDITDRGLKSLLLELKPDVINHHAAQIEVRTSLEDPVHDARVNILGSLSLLEIARQIPNFKKFIFASSGGAVYGDADQIPTEEAYPPAPLSPYGAAKLSIEYYLNYYYQVFGMESVRLRYSNVYGPRQNPHGEAGVVAIFFERVLNNQEFVINGQGNQTRDFVYVSDVVKANLACLETDFVGNLNISTGKETSVNQLVAEMAKAIGHQPDFPHGPAKAGEQARSCLAWQLAREKLGWQPEVDLSTGIQTTAEYFQQR